MNGESFRLIQSKTEAGSLLVRADRTVPLQPWFCRGIPASTTPGPYPKECDTSGPPIREPSHENRYPFTN